MIIKLKIKVLNLSLKQIDEIYFV